MPNILIVWAVHSNFFQVVLSVGKYNSFPVEKVSKTTSVKGSRSTSNELNQVDSIGLYIM